MGGYRGWRPDSLYHGAFTGYEEKGCRHSILTMSGLRMHAGGMAGGQILRFIDGQLVAFSPRRLGKRSEGWQTREPPRRPPANRKGILYVGYRSEGWDTTDGLPSMNRAGGTGLTMVAARFDRHRWRIGQN
jgi:hypothetical protein